MSAYTELRAKQKARIKSAGAMQLHRIVDLEADDFCAQEGGFIVADAQPVEVVGCTFSTERQGRGPLPKVTKPSKTERTEVAKFWRVAACFGIAVGSVLLLVHWGVSK